MIAGFVSARILRVFFYPACAAAQKAIRPAGRFLLLLLVCCCGPVALADHAEPVLAEFVDTLDPPALIPGADRLGDIEEASPVIPLYKGDEQLGYVFVTSDFVNTNGYSGKPIDILVSVDMQGVIRSINLLRHAEPIVLIGIPEAQ